jgi:phosphate-selective porin OprO/OprP
LAIVLSGIHGLTFAQDVVLPASQEAAAFEVAYDQYSTAHSLVLVDTSDPDQSTKKCVEVEKELEKLKKQVEDLSKSEEDRKEKTAKLPTAKITSQIQPDLYWFSQDTENRSEVGDIQDGSAFRRARIGITGDYGPAQYRVEFDWALSNRPNFLDVWVGVVDVGGMDSIRVGHFSEPFSLERMTPNRFTVFLERSLIDSAFAPARNLGAMVQNEMSDEMGTWAVGGFRTNSDGFGDDVGDFGENAVTSRLTRLLWHDDSCDSLSMLHIGGSYSFRDADNRVSRFRSQPEARVGAIVINNVPNFVDSGNIPTESFQLFGLEAAWVRGPFSTQSEYMWAPVNVLNGQGALMQGCYGQVSYFLTGEHRPFKKSDAVFDRVIPRRNFVTNGKGRVTEGPGAWEVAARLSHLDLNDGSIAGGKITDLTIGTTWYMNPFLHVTTNYLHAFLERDSRKSNADIFGVRVNFDF